MFETSIEKATRGRRPKSLRYLPIALGLHGLVLGVVVVSQVWTVTAVADPPEFVTFRVQLPPPAPPPGGSKPVVKPDKPVAQTPPVAPTQPEDVPEEIAPATAGMDSTSTQEVNGGLPDLGGGEGESEGPGIGDGPELEPAPEPDLTVPVELSDDMVAPVVLRRVDPKYTPLAIAARKNGVVVVQATITREGNVVDVRVMKTLGYGLDDAAVNAVRQWKFKPAERFGRPAAVLYNLTVKFQLR